MEEKAFHRLAAAVGTTLVWTWMEASMRRKDKEVTDPSKIEEFIRKASVLRIALFDDPFPYLVPVNFGYRGQSFWFHSALEGKKIDLLRRNDRVCFQTEAECGLIEADTPCKWSSRYASVIGYGRARLIENMEEKLKGLEAVFRQYSDAPFEVPESSLERIAVIKIEVESMTGKVSGWS